MSRQKFVNYTRVLGKPNYWKNRTSYLARLPDHYYWNTVKQLERPGYRVHDVPKQSDLLDYKMVNPDTLRIERVDDTPVIVKYPVESDEGLWGGEGLVRGFFKRRDYYGKYRAQTFFPNILQTIVYSEILDKHMRVTVTQRTLMLIDQMKGFDDYILRTPLEDLKSQLGCDLRRKMLVSLAKKDYSQDDLNRQQYICEKYKDVTIPLEEAEWVGLPMLKALTKKKIEEAVKMKAVPLKVKFTKELLQKLEVMKTDGKLPEISEPTWFDKLLDYGKKKPKSKVKELK